MARLTQEVVEYASQPNTTAARVTQDVVELTYAPAITAARVTQMVIELLIVVGAVPPGGGGGGGNPPNPSSRAFCILNPGPGITPALALAHEPQDTPVVPLAITMEPLEN